VEGGNAAAFGQDQAQSIQSHTHTYMEAQERGAWGGDVFSGASGLSLISRNTGTTGSAETRPVNTTIRVWVRRS
jgi:hypothetical protein